MVVAQPPPTWRCCCVASDVVFLKYPESEQSRWIDGYFEMHTPSQSELVTIHTHDSLFPACLLFFRWMFPLLTVYSTLLTIRASVAHHACSLLIPRPPIADRHSIARGLVMALSLGSSLLVGAERLPAVNRRVEVLLNKLATFSVKGCTRYRHWSKDQRWRGQLDYCAGQFEYFCTKVKMMCDCTRLMYRDND